MDRNSVFRYASPGLAFHRADVGEVVVERGRAGQPHKGKVFAAVHAHLDDIPYYAAGLCAKLMAEGYTGYIIRTSNDEKCGGGTTAGNILSNEQDHQRMARALGFADEFNFYYRNHRMDGVSSIDLRGRLILLFRMLKVDTLISFNPWGHGEENPDHWVTGRAAEEACWMCSMRNDFHEHLEAGIQPHPVRERYYFCARPGQPFNRVVDIGSVVDKKVDSIVECKSQGGGDNGAKLRARLAREGNRLAILGEDDLTANRAYVREFLLEDNRSYAADHGLDYAERFYYIDTRSSRRSRVDEFVKQNAVPI